MVIEDGSMAGAFASLLPAIFATAAALWAKTLTGMEREVKERLRTLISFLAAGTEERCEIHRPCC